MKIKLLSLLFPAFIGLSVNAQINDCNTQGDVCSALGPKFVAGVTGAINEFYAFQANAPATTQDVYFWATDTTYTVTYAQGWGTYDSPSQLWYWDIDMGTLPDDAVIYGEYLDASRTSLGYTDDYIPQFIQKPDWMTAVFNGTATVLNIDYTNNKLDLDGVLPIWIIRSMLTPHPGKEKEYFFNFPKNCRSGRC